MGHLWERSGHIHRERGLGSLSTRVGEELMCIMWRRVCPKADPSITVMMSSGHDGSEMPL